MRNEGITGFIETCEYEVVLKAQLNSGIALFMGNEENFVITKDAYKLIGKQKPKTCEDVENQKL